ncbi:hypothetical protein HDV00_005575 [Rhizophlyctis rosea]|nr:hypothetical protein HDV00_005575 [Rhizophlyctis rosea]
MTFSLRLKKTSPEPPPDPQTRKKDGPIRKVYISTPPPPQETHDAHGRLKQHFPPNWIRTSKYNVFTFLPKNLFEQFRRAANMYFLLLVILQSFHVYQTINPVVAALPLIVIVSLTAIKDGFEDWKRHKSDQEVNGMMVGRVEGGEWTNTNGVYFVRRGRGEGEGTGLGGKIKEWFEDRMEDFKGWVWISTHHDHKRRRKNKERKPSQSASHAPRLSFARSSFARSASFKVHPNRPPEWSPTQWSDLHVGDVLLLHNNDPIPADLLLLSTSESGCLAYIETKNLDGETNLKIRKGPDETSWMKDPQDVLDGLRGVVECEAPSNKLYEFRGTLVLEEPVDEVDDGTMGGVACAGANSAYPEAGSNSLTYGGESTLSRTAETDSSKSDYGNNGTTAVASSSSASSPQPISSSATSPTSPPPPPMTKVPLSINSILLRGCSLRNTTWAIGIVLYTGPETKIRLNAGITPSKRSYLEIKMNNLIFVNLALLVIMCLVCCIGNPLWEDRYAETGASWLDWTYLTKDLNAPWSGFVLFWLTLITFQNVVPISLYLTVEVVKTLQAFFIWQDIEMYYPPIDQPCIPRSWNLADDLGQIEYVFSDKTGTLTRNVMEFKKFSVGGVVYGQGFGEEIKGEDMRPSTVSVSNERGRPQTRSGTGDGRVAGNDGGTDRGGRARQGTVRFGGVEEFPVPGRGDEEKVEGMTEQKSSRPPTALKEYAPLPAIAPPAATSGSHSSNRPSLPADWGPSSGSVDSSLTPYRSLSSSRSLQPLPPNPKPTVHSPSSQSFHSWNTRPPNISTPPVRPSFWDALLETHLATPNTPHHASLANFFFSLALCHSVLVSSTPAENPADPPTLTYKAQSPDEAALVQAAKEAGFAFVARESMDMIVKVSLPSPPASDLRLSTSSSNSSLLPTPLPPPEPTTHRHTLLTVFEFNSTRKRMSVIVRTPQQKIVLYCKGADSVIYSRLRAGQETLKSVTAAHLEYFAEEGLRTLCIAERELSEEEYGEFKKRYDIAATSHGDRDRELDEVAESVEKDMVLVGATAIEDKLQEGVPECIATLMDAGLKLWVLTGDKMETAINIGFSCNLLTRDMTLIVVRGGSGEGEGAEDEESVGRQMREAVEGFFGDAGKTGCTAGGGGRGSVRSGRVAPEHEPPPPYTPPHTRFALIIDGSALRHALRSPNDKTLLALATRCTTVICCRVSPLQKANVVTLVKHNLKAMCLAIGDGANDVSMIQAADVGVGIAGEEGVQAVMSADYAIGQFRFLGRLLLVHGRWCYRRVAEMVLTFLAKNIVWVQVLFWYQIYCGLSQTLIYDFTYMLLYNLVFTSLPIGLLGVLDQDVPAFAAVLVPPLYRPNISHSLFTNWRFILYTFEALYVSLVVFYGTYFTYRDCVLYGNGQPEDSRIMAVVLGIIGVVNSNMLVVVNSSNWNIINGSVIIISDLLVFLYTLIYCSLPDSDLYGAVGMVFGSVWFWTVLIMTTWVAHSPRFIVRVIGRFWCPMDVDIVREACKVEGGVEELVWSGRLLGADGVSGMEMGKGQELDIGDGAVGRRSRIGSVRGVGAMPIAGPPAMTVVEAIPVLEPDTSVADIPDTSLTPPTPSAEVPPPTTAAALPPRITSAPPRLNARLSMRSIPARMTSTIQDASFFEPQPQTYPSPQQHPSSTPQAQANLPSPAQPRMSLISTPIHRRTSSTSSFHPSPHVTPTARAATAPAEDHDPTTPHLQVMSTHQILRNRGYSFSQSAGGRDVILSANPTTSSDDDGDGLAASALRRRSRARSMVQHRPGRSLDNIVPPLGVDRPPPTPSGLATDSARRVSGSGDDVPARRAHTMKERKGARKRAVTEGAGGESGRPILESIMQSPPASKPASRTVSRNSPKAPRKALQRGGGSNIAEGGETTETADPKKSEASKPEAGTEGSGGADVTPVVQEDNDSREEGRRSATRGPVSLRVVGVPGMVQGVSNVDVSQVVVVADDGTGVHRVVEREHNADAESVMESSQ